MVIEDDLQNAVQTSDLKWMRHAGIQPFWCQEHLASKNMST